MFAFGKKNKNNRISGLSGTSRYNNSQRRNTAGNEWLASQLKFRIQVLEVDQTEESSNFGFNQKYKRLKTIWGGMIPISHNSYRQFVSTEGFGNISHEFIFRYSAIEDLNSIYSSAFATAFDSISDINPLKSDMFLFVEKGSNSKGRMFRIRRVMNNDENDEYLSILAEEVEELGTGANYDSDYISE